MFVGVACLFCVTLACDAFNYERRPTISFITQPEIVADIGDEIEIKCSVQYAQDFPVIWLYTYLHISCIVILVL
jgi:hypothetical protein